MDVKQFIEQRHEKKGKLARWEAEIFELHRGRMSYEKIAEFLRSHAVQVCRIEVYRYIHRNKRRHLLQGPLATTLGVTPDSGSAARQVPPCSDAPATDTAASQAQAGTLPKFSWQQSRTKDKPTW